MMDIQNIWKQGSGTDDALNNILQNDDFTKRHSQLPLQKLKKNLLTSIAGAVFITAVYIAVLFYMHIWEVYAALGVLILFNVWTIFESRRLYKLIPDGMDPTRSLKQELIKNHDAFQRWWSLQLKVSLFIYPIATAGGFILGGVLSSGKTVEEFLYNLRMLTFLGITVLVFMPISFYAAKWFFNHAYGKHLKKMKALIDELSE
jgi:hypothetical protein